MEYATWISEIIANYNIYIYMCVCVCIHIIGQLQLTYFFIVL